MRVHQKSITFILFFCILISCKASKKFETEPNNTFKTANPVRLNEEIFGYLNTESDIDNYILKIDDEQILSIELSAIKGINHAIHIYRLDGYSCKLIKIIDDNRKSSPEEMPNLFVAPGEYIITIQHGSRDVKKANIETPYRLLLTSRSFNNEEKEPNDDSGAATLILPDKSITGFFSPSQNSLNKSEHNPMREEDWYRIDIQSWDGSPLLLDISLTGVNGIDSLITVINNRYEELFKADNFGQGQGEVIENLGIREPGSYYIIVASKNFQSNNKEKYQLTVKTRKNDQNYEIEPNNSRNTANTIINNTISGKISYISDQDFYYFCPEQKKRYYMISCLPQRGLDLQMIIFDTNGNKILSINNTGYGEGEVIPDLFIKDAVYIDIISSGRILGDADYRIDINQIEFNGPIETEYNNTRETANIITNEITGYITYKDDTDYFLVRSETRDSYKITVHGIKNGKIKLSTTDPIGYIIKTYEINENSEISFTEIFDRKGFIIVEPVKPDYYNSYKIMLEKIR